MGDHKEMHLVAGVISHLVRCAWWNPNPFTSSHHDGAAIHFHDRFAREDVEKLLRMMVEVANLRGARRHALLNYAELRTLYQMPSITAVSPDVMLGGCFADRADIHSRWNLDPW